MSEAMSLCKRDKVFLLFLGGNAVEFLKFMCVFVCKFF